MRIRRSLASLVFVMAACGTAAAQESGQVGITMGFPASIGVIFHVSDAVAVRPEFAFNHTTTESTFFTSTSWTFGTGVSALFYLHAFDRVRPYVSPRFTYTRGDASSDAIGASGATSTGTAFSGSFGAQYSPSSKFSVFGETGFGYTHASSKSDASSTEIKSNGWGTRAGVGIIFYF